MLRPQAAPNVIQVPTDDQRRTSLDAFERVAFDEALQLLAAFTSSQSKVQIVHDQRMLMAIDLRPYVCLQQPACFAIADREVQVRKAVHRPARKDQVAIAPMAELMLGVKSGVTIEVFRQDGDLVVASQIGNALGHLLQQYDVGGYRFEYGDRTAQVIATIHSAHTLVDVPGHDAQ